MKQRSTTPVSPSLATRAAIVAASVLMLVATPVQFVPKAYADQYDDQIAAIQREINQYQSAAKDLQSKANTLQNELSRLANEKSALQAQLDASQTKYNQLVKNIKQAQDRIKQNRVVVGELIVNDSVSDKVSPFVRIAGSDNLAKSIDEIGNAQSAQDDIISKIKEIESLKKKLERDKKEVERVLVEQKSQRDLLASKENERATLLADTRGEEAAYQQLSSKRQGDIANLYAQQQAAIFAATGGGTRTSGAVGSFQFRNYSGELGCVGGYGSGSDGSYGCQYGHDAVVDEFSLYNRECVSYAAWAAKYRFGGRVTSFMGMGNAYEWENPGTAPLTMGASINDTPSRGAVAIRPITPGFPLGHAMVVENVLGDGWIRVSQYNFAVNGQYSTMEIPANAVRYVHFR